MKVVLIGFMGTGKSKVGKILAQKLGWPHFDTDDMITKDVGASPGDIIRKRGEAPFREIERKAVQLLSTIDRCVISTGGGVPLDKSNMSDLSKNAHTVWLKARPDTILKRAGDLKSRPLIDPKNPLESIRQRLSEREKSYAVAQSAIETDGLNPDQVADQIFSLVKPA